MCSKIKRKTIDWYKKGTLDAKTLIGVQSKGSLDTENQFRVQKMRKASILDAKTLIGVQDWKFWTSPTTFASKLNWF